MSFIAAYVTYGLIVETQKRTSRKHLFHKASWLCLVSSEIEVLGLSRLVALNDVIHLALGYFMN